MDRRPRVPAAGATAPRGRNGGHARPLRRGRPAPGLPRRAAIFVCGSDAFASRMFAALGSVPGVEIVGWSNGDGMSAGLGRAGWPDVMIIDAAVGHWLTIDRASLELLEPKGRGARCAVVMIADSADGSVSSPEPVVLWPGWSVLLEGSSKNPALLGAAVQYAARGVATIDHRIDESTIAYASAPRRAGNTGG